MATPDIATCLWFDGQGRAAADFYVSLFEHAHLGETNGLMTPFHLNGQSFLALDGGPQFTLSPACSISVTVDGQEEVDRLWEALLADGGSEARCGWLTDRFGLSWQIVPKQLVALMSDPDPAAAARVRDAMLQMVKIEVAGLEAAHRGN